MTTLVQEMNKELDNYLNTLLKPYENKKSNKHINTKVVIDINKLSSKTQMQLSYIIHQKKIPEI